MLYMLLTIVLAILVLMCSPGLRKWFKDGWRDLKSQRFILVFSFVVFTLLLGTAIPYHNFENGKEFSEYISFAAPCLAGIVVGGGFLFEPNKPLDRNAYLFLYSVILILIAYWFFVHDHSYDGKVWLWVIVISVMSFTLSLLGIAVAKDYSKVSPAESFFPFLVIGGGIAVTLIGFMSVIFDKSLGVG